MLHSQEQMAISWDQRLWANAITYVEEVLKQWIERFQSLFQQLRFDVLHLCQRNSSIENLPVEL